MRLNSQYNSLYTNSVKPFNRHVYFEIERALLSDHTFALQHPPFKTLKEKETFVWSKQFMIVCVLPFVEEQ